MNSDAEAIETLRENLPTSMSHAALYARAPVAHKWKAPLRAVVLKDTLHWRLFDLVQQANHLNEGQHILGARILIRSSIETVGMFVYLNEKIQDVLDGKLDFHSFDNLTRQLLLGKRLEDAKYKSVNILTVLKKMEATYPGIWGIYERLSESAHPNYHSTCMGYSKIDYENYVTHYAIEWQSFAPAKPAGLISAVGIIFKREYDRWINLFENLENWIIANDVELEATKNND
jgi:hypothetical protein